MGVDIHLRVCYWDRFKHSYEEIKLYRKDGDQFKLIPLFSGRNSELFDYLNGAEGDLPFKGIDLEDSTLPKELHDEISECKNITGYYDFFEINLADLKLYFNKHPKARDWDEEDEIYKDHPIKYFIELIESILSVANVWFDFYSEIRIFYWFDC